MIMACHGGKWYVAFPVGFPSDVETECYDKGEHSGHDQKRQGAVEWYFTKAFMFVNNIATF